MKSLLLVFLFVSTTMAAPPRKVAPTWLHRYVPDIADATTDFTTPTCHYKPIFGEGDSEARAVQSVAHFGEVTVDAGGSCKSVSDPREERIYFVLEGSGILDAGNSKLALKKEDFSYVPPGIQHGLANSTGQPCTLVLMGFKIPPGTPAPSGASVRVANSLDVRQQTDVGHPTSVLYRLLLGNEKGANDKLDVGITVTSLFLMEFAPGGTNFPHHHEIAEEIYLVLDGHGLMAAGGGMDGVEGLHPAKAGDAYFFRPDCTVGFFDSHDGKAHILAVRSWVPIPSRHYNN
jgi:mannose-6-phosphate isomerase-like protein (cupin superfamily)